MTKKVMVIAATTRPERMGLTVAQWAHKELQKLDVKTTYNLEDLKERNLPLMDEPSPPAMGKPYTKDHSKEWSKAVAEHDGFIIVTPEYNGGYPAPIKNAIDFLYTEWAEKPIAFIGYGAGPADNAIKQLQEVTARIKMKNIQATVRIPQVFKAIDKTGSIKPDALQGSLATIAQELTKAM